MKKRLIIGFFVMLFYLSSMIFSLAFSEGSITIEAGFDGKVKPGVMNPIKLNIQSQEDPFNGELEIKLGEESYFLGVDLERNTKKEFISFLPFDGKDREIQVILYNGGKEEKEVYKIEMLEKEVLLIGLLSRDNRPINYLQSRGNSRLGYDTAMIVNIADKSYFSSDHLRAFDFLVIDQYDTQQLSEEFLQRIRFWIQEGNTLFVKDSNAAASIAGEEINEKNKNHPLAFGKGNIVVLKEPVENIDEYFDLYYPYSRLQQRNNHTDKALDEVERIFASGDLWQRDGYGGVYSYIALLIIYLLLLIAADQYKKEKIFIGILLLSTVVFVVATNFIEFGTKTFAVLEIREGCYVTDIHTFMRFQNSRENTRLKMKGEAIRDYSEGISKVYLDEGSIVFQEKGEQRLYRRATEASETTKIEVHVSAEDVLKGTIENPFSKTLEQAGLLIGDTFIPIGDIKGKERIQLHYKLDHNLSNTSDFKYLSTIFIQGGFNHLQRMLYEYYYYHQDEGLYNMKLIGFSSETERMEQNSKSIKNDKYVMHVLEVDFQKEKEMVYPMGTIKPQTIYEGYVEGVSKREFILEEEENLLIYYNIPRHSKIESIEVQMKLETGNPVIEVFNQATEMWEDIGYLSISPIDNYIFKEPLAIKVSGKTRILLPQIRVLTEEENRDA
ncbi:hypothetical protein [Clostridium formicaceticum]|uniref:Uncharacterized protein n=1 Tax=Clostridium formicaceticum TaxID=1497 RepID=A0AAC9RIR6_9CLOT|nr:hypothetical protein [Clostridium formicaceticum]AOY75874.1 hypothetical protein BJL90_08195 [Clostridium formicaceticum]ARE86215.1 hypothetical protein CLFO_05370 [Clostridium formicaceticum]